jgi:hypothetical protein
MPESYNNFVTVAYLTAITGAVVDLLGCVFCGFAPLNYTVIPGMVFGAYSSHDLVYRPMARIRQKGILSHVVIIRQRHSVRALLYLLLSGLPAILVGFPVEQLFQSTVMLWIFGLSSAATGAYCASFVREIRAPDLFRQR